MLTLTYRENMTDRARMARDFGDLHEAHPSHLSWLRVRVRLRGAEAWCMACPSGRAACPESLLAQGVLVKSYDLLRAVWRAVVGQGNVDISRARRHSQRNIAKLAAYLSKYLSKTFDAGGVGDSYRASGKALPKPVVVRSLATDLGGAGSDLLGLLFKFYSVRTSP